MADEKNNTMTTVVAEDDDPAVMMDADEREDALSNALANKIANYTPGSCLGGGGDKTNGKSWLEGDETLQRLLDAYGCASQSPISSPGENNTNVSTLVDSLGRISNRPG